MAKDEMITLTSTREAEVTLAEPRPPRIIRVRYLQEYGGRAHYYLDGWPWPVPAWARRFDGWTVRAVARLVAAGLVVALAFVVWLLRLLGRAK